MVALFKKLPGAWPSHRISYEELDRHLRRTPPWYFADKCRGEASYFAVCPYCDNPIQIKALFARKPNSPRPYGSHLGKSVAPFLKFDRAAQECCPYIQKTPVGSKDRKRLSGPLNQEILKLICLNYDLVADELRQSTGIDFSAAFARRLLTDFVNVAGHEYYRASIQNAPYMVLYFASGQNLYAQQLRCPSSIADVLQEKVPNILITESGVIQSRFGFVKISVEFVLHKQRSDKAGLEETLLMRIFDDTVRQVNADQAPIYEEEIVLKAERFQRAVQQALPNRRHYLRDFGIAKLNELGIGKHDD